MRYREDSSKKGKQIYQVSPTSNILSFIKHNKRFQLIANMARWDSPRRCKSEFAQIENNKIKYCQGIKLNKPGIGSLPFTTPYHELNIFVNKSLPFTTPYHELNIKYWKTSRKCLFKMHWKRICLYQNAYTIKYF